MAKITVSQCECCKKYEEDLVNGLCMECEDQPPVDPERENYLDFLIAQDDLEDERDPYMGLDLDSDFYPEDEDYDRYAHLYHGADYGCWEPREVDEVDERLILGEA